MRQEKPSTARSKGKQRRSEPAAVAAGSPSSKEEVVPTSTEIASEDAATETLDLQQRPTTAPPRSGVQHAIPVFEPSRVPRISLKTG
jgi:hypothetical protein